MAASPACFHGPRPVAWVSLGGCRVDGVEPTVLQERGLAAPLCDDGRAASRVCSRERGVRWQTLRVRGAPGCASTVSAVARCVEYRFC